MLNIKIPLLLKQGGQLLFDSHNWRNMWYGIKCIYSDYNPSYSCLKTELLVWRKTSIKGQHIFSRYKERRPSYNLNFIFNVQISFLYYCYSLNLECILKHHVLEAWLQFCALLGSVWNKWKVVLSGRKLAHEGDALKRGYWGPCSLLLLSSSCPGVSSHFPLPHVMIY